MALYGIYLGRDKRSSIYRPYRRSGRRPIYGRAGGQLTEMERKFKSARNPRKEKHGGKEGDSSSGINGNGSVHWPGKAL